MSVAAFEIISSISTAERRRIVDVALVEGDVLLGQIGAVKHELAATKMKIDMQIEFGRRRNFSEGFQGDICRTPAAKCKKNFTRACRSIADIHSIFVHPRF